MLEITGLITDVLAECLHASGCRRVYGLVGEDHIELLASLEQVGIRYVRAYNESSAVLMASADAQATGTCGVVVVSMSAGMSNAVNGLAHAFMEQVPLIVISGQLAGAERPFIVRQGFDVESLARPVTKWQVRAAPGVNMSQLVAKALYVAHEVPKGPVYLEVPSEVGRGETNGADKRWFPRIDQEQSSAPHYRPRQLDRSEIEYLRDKLVSARRPIIILGGRQHLELNELLNALSSQLRAPTFVTTNQKGSIDPQADYFAGVFLNSNPEVQLLEQSDLILAINLAAFDIYSRRWNFDAEVVSLSVGPIAETVIPFNHEFVGDPGQAMATLLEDAGLVGNSTWTAEDVRAYRDGLVSALTKLDHCAGAMTTSDVVSVLQKVIPNDSNLVVDAGFSKPIITHLWPTGRPNSFFASNAFGTMGHALPTAIALALVNPDRTTLAIMGDGSLLMRAGELQAAADAGVSLIVVALLDQSFTQIAVKQERRGMEPIGVRLPVVSGTAIGAAFGCTGADVETAAEFEEALVTARHSDVPYLIGVHISNASASNVFGYLRG